MKCWKKLLSSLLTGCLLLASLCPAEVAFAVTAGSLTVCNLRTELLENPIGLDVENPTLSWENKSSENGQRQTGYRILAASSQALLDADTGDLWDTGKVSDTACFGIVWGGSPLTSRQKVYWKVMTWDLNRKASDWSETATFEMGLLSDADWTAQWIGRGVDSNVMINHFDSVTARYVRLQVREIGGNPQAENLNRLQVMEWEIFQGDGENLALGKPAAASDALNATGSWSPENLTDGQTYGGNHGYSSGVLSGTKLSTPVTLTVDLGAQETFDTFRLYARSDALQADGVTCPDYPKVYDIQVSDDGLSFRTVETVEITDPPKYTAALPIFAKEFQLSGDVQSARLYISGLGLYTATVNGQNVADTLFDPNETDWDTRVQYVTYDVTDLLQEGGNGLGIALGNGVYNVGSTPGRYQKHDNAGELKAIAQLEIIYTDGSTQRIVTDNTWAQTTGPLTFSSWYGGEDYDATREILRWDLYGTDRSDWGQAAKVNAPAGQLCARNTTPIRITDTVTPVSVKHLANGAYLVDMGVNYAGIYTLRMETSAAHRGQTVTLYPTEQLNASGDGVNQVSMTNNDLPIYDSYVMAGTGAESFTLQFCYHGFQYLYIENYPGTLTIADITGYIVRADNAADGSFETSNETLNAICRIVNRSVEANMQSVLTDCPDREKLGWLEVSQLMYYSMGYAYDIQSWTRKLLQDMADSQYPDGKVPCVAPEYVQFPGDMSSEVNWGGACILTAYYCYQMYGDLSVLETGYDTMAGYVKYLKTQSSGDLIDFGLGDWGSYDSTTPRGLVVSAAYYYEVQAMAEIAGILNKPEEAKAYQELAANIKTAFNKKYFNAATCVYGSGSQASYACALFSGLVPEEYEAAVLDQLVAEIEAWEWHLSTGEVGLRQMLVVLGRYGRSDVVYRMVTCMDQPSYGYFLTRGATSLPEFWDMSQSQNHCMMGHVVEWFYAYLLGLQLDTPGGSHLVIRPYVPEDLDWVKGATHTPYGMAAVVWQQLAGDGLQLTATVPVGVTADVYLPYGEDEVLVDGQAVTGQREGEYLVLSELGSGNHTILCPGVKICSISANVEEPILEVGEIAQALGLSDSTRIAVTGQTADGTEYRIPSGSLTFTAGESVSVDDAGKVTGLTVGSTTVTVQCGDLTTKVLVTVNETTVRRLQAVFSKRTLHFAGDGLRLSARVVTNSGKTVEAAGLPDLYFQTVSDAVEIRDNVLTCRSMAAEQAQVSVTWQGVTSPDKTLYLAAGKNIASTATVTASSTAEGGRSYAPASVVNGDTTGNRWEHDGGWSSATTDGSDTWLELDFGQPQSISQVEIYMLQNQYATCAAPDLTTTATSYGLRNFQVQYWTGESWELLPGGSISENIYAVVQVGFPALETQKVRIFIPKATDYARLVEVQVWQDGITYTEEPVEPELLPGDMNLDGTLSVTDVVLLRKAILNKQYEQMGDLNGDFTLSVTDVVLLRKEILNT